MELEQNGTLPFLDVLVKKNRDGTLAHMMYRKTTNTGLYLHVDSEHHPTQTRTVLSTLTYCAWTICDKDVLQDEIHHLQANLQKQWLCWRDIHYAVCARNKPPTTSEKTMGVALLLYEHLTPNKISRLLAKRNIKTICIPRKKIF